MLHVYDQSKFAKTNALSVIYFDIIIQYWRRNGIYNQIPVSFADSQRIISFSILTDRVKERIHD